MKSKKPFLHQLYLDSLKHIDTSTDKKVFAVAVNKYFKEEIDLHLGLDLSPLPLYKIKTRQKDSYTEIVGGIYNHFIKKIEKVKTWEH